MNHALLLKGLRLPIFTFVNGVEAMNHALLLKGLRLLEALQ